MADRSELGEFLSGLPPYRLSKEEVQEARWDLLPCFRRPCRCEAEGRVGAASFCKALGRRWRVELDPHPGKQWQAPWCTPEGGECAWCTTVRTGRAPGRPARVRRSVRNHRRRGKGYALYVRRYTTSSSEDTDSTASAFVSRGSRYNCTNRPTCLLQNWADGLLPRVSPDTCIVYLSPGFFASSASSTADST